MAPVKVQLFIVHATRKTRPVKLYFVNSSLPPSIHQHGYLTTEDVAHTQCHEKPSSLTGLIFLVDPRIIMEHSNPAFQNPSPDRRAAGTEQFFPRCSSLRDCPPRSPG